MREEASEMAFSRQDPRIRADLPLADLRCVLSSASAILWCQENQCFASNANFYGSALPLHLGGQNVDAGAAKVDKSLWLGSNGNKNTQLSNCDPVSLGLRCRCGARQKLSTDGSLTPGEKHISIIESAKTHRGGQRHFYRGYRNLEIKLIYQRRSLSASVRKCDMP